MQVGTRLRQALQAAWRYERSAPTLNGAQLAELMAHPWPGNVRELHNVADRFVLGLPKQTLYDKLRRLRISTDSFKPEG